MADLAGQQALVDLVIRIGIVPGAHLRVTGFARGSLLSCISVICLNSVDAFLGRMAFFTALTDVMHLAAGVAVYAVHAFLAEVNIPGDALVLAEVFIAHAAAVTGCAVSGHRGGFHDQVTLNKASADRGGLADVTITAAGVAG